MLYFYLLNTAPCYIAIYLLNTATCYITINQILPRNLRYLLNTTRGVSLIVEYSVYLLSVHRVKVYLTKEMNLLLKCVPYV